MTTREKMEWYVLRGANGIPSMATPAESLAAMLATLPFLCLRWCNVDKRQLEIVGHDFGRVLARAQRSLPASADKLSRCSAQAVGSNNARRVLAAQPRSCE
jgi:hypothetical protein